MAQDQASLGLYDFNYSRFLLKDLFDIVMSEDVYMEKAYNVFREIGNIARGTYKYEFVVDENCEAQLPCNVEYIEAVKYGDHWDSSLYPNAIHWELGYDPYSEIPQIMQASSYFRENRTTNLHLEGEFKRYNLKLGGTVGEYKLTFTEDQIGTSGVCLYRGMLVDGDGNPLLNEKERDAIAYKLAYLETMKGAFKKDSASMGLLPWIKQEAERKMVAAKIPMYITQNQWDMIMSAATSHNRKVFWASYNPLA